jgi:hypothetical protein
MSKMRSGTTTINGSKRLQYNVMTFAGSKSFQSALHRLSQLPRFTPKTKLQHSMGQTFREVPTPNGIPVPKEFPAHHKNIPFKRKSTLVNEKMMALLKFQQVGRNAK